MHVWNLQENLPEDCKSLSVKGEAFALPSFNFSHISVSTIPSCLSLLDSFFHVKKNSEARKENGATSQHLEQNFEYSIDSATSQYRKNFYTKKGFQNTVKELHLIFSCDDLYAKHKCCCFLNTISC